MSSVSGIRFIVFGDIKSPYKCCVWVKSYQAVVVAEEVQMLRHVTLYGR
jgi:hypothetical protein